MSNLLNETYSKCQEPLFVLIPKEPVELPIYEVSNDLLMIAPSSQKEENNSIVSSQVAQVVYQNHLEIHNNHWEFREMTEAVSGPPSIHNFHQEDQKNNSK